jgi:oligopeptide/dipeptide ABC transporter ATP-binding protein
MSKTILEVQNLKKYYAAPGGMFSSFKKNHNVIPAVDDVSFYIKENETMGLVGETGCGKTTIGRSVLKLTPVTAGRIIFDGSDITGLSASKFRPYRSRMQMIFQDLDAALNPKMRIRSILKEALTVYSGQDGTEVDRRIAELLDMVNLKKSKLNNYPGELSGGEKRRVGIARSLAVNPRFVVADEPTSALDVSIQAQVVNLLRELQKNLNLSYLFISHDLRIVELISHKVAVMYLGQIVEMGMAGTIAHAPRHPYTAVLWSSLVDKRSREGDGSVALPEEKQWGVFDFERPQAGCRFAPRCPVYEVKGHPPFCTNPATAPELRKIDDAHHVRCHYPLNGE